MFLTEWWSLDSLENAKNFPRFYHSFRCNVCWMVVLSAAWWRHTPILVLKPTGIVFSAYLFFMNGGVMWLLPTIMLITLSSASPSCTVAWPDFLTPDAAECQRVHAVISHALMIGPHDSWHLPSLLGFLVCQCCMRICRCEAFSSL